MCFQDHKPNMPSELERVKQLGGTIRWYGLLEQDGTPMEGEAPCSLFLEVPTTAF